MGLSASVRRTGERSQPSSAARRLPAADQNLSGYVSQPVYLISTLSSLPALWNTGYYGNKLDSRDPISVIRVLVPAYRPEQPLAGAD